MRLRLIAGLVLAGGLLAGCGHGGTDADAASVPGAAPTQADTYGGYPAFLPADTVGSGFQHRVVDASARKPALATQGDTVRVHQGSTSVLATVTGPAVPVAGLPYQSPTSPATWSVVLQGANRALPLDPDTFQAVDEAGSIYHLRAQGRVPAEVRPGQVVRFKLFAPGIATGEGRMRWIPTGHLAPVEWDFVVETD